MRDKKFSIKSRLKSFGYAFNGLKILWMNEHNARIHLTAAVVAIVAGFLWHISCTEWLAIIFAIGFVFAAEAFNSAIEYLADHVSPEYNPKIKMVKDLSAAAVLLAAIAALAVGLVIFIPKILSV